MILFVLFGGSVGAVVFLHTQYGWEAVKQVDDDDDDDVDDGDGEDFEVNDDDDEDEVANGLN